ncbi:MAG: hypothetical protein M3N19_01975 [Candidatus Eremiobacteraeota bacterium]|nr:hypothetical protein [Candidatus Eremiobacteraeota bacterium]
MSSRGEENAAAAAQSPAMFAFRLLWIALATLVLCMTPATAATGTAPWFPSLLCPAFKDGHTSPPVIKTDPEHLEHLLDFVLGKRHTVYDKQHGIALQNDGNDTWGAWILRKTSAPPPAMGILTADLSRVQTTHGAHIGMSASALRQKFGKPLVLAGCGMVRYVYTTDREIGNSIEFTLKNDQVIEIFFTYGD